MTLEEALLAAFQSFAAAHRAHVLRLRERELVSRFAFGHLLPQCRPGGALFDPRQIGIEVAVPQRSGDGTRRQPDVCKDLVIWPGVDGSCWDSAGHPTRFPAAVLEWKSIDRGERPGDRRDKLERQTSADLGWLDWLTSASPTTEGYFALVQPAGTGLSIDVTRVSSGGRQPHWFRSEESNPPVA
jgi:hypothetical protein